uniref:Uncharacterized protein n=1 Tax=virus sp. ctnRj46 TaxID=2826814 RepID=A0A8S5R834_9VIRU|nr:MAG TPA: hypothetical protein [virus sp. ctnRj46]
MIITIFVFNNTNIPLSIFSSYTIKPYCNYFTVTHSI